ASFCHEHRPRISLPWQPCRTPEGLIALLRCSAARLFFDRDELAALIATTRADGNDLSFLRFFLRGIRNDDAATGLLFSFDPLDNNPIVRWTEFHGFASSPA